MNREPGTGRGCPMSAPVVLGGDLKILPPDIPVRVFVLNSEIREMDLIIDNTRQKMQSRRVHNLIHSHLGGRIDVGNLRIFNYDRHGLDPVG